MQVYWTKQMWMTLYSWFYKLLPAPKWQLGLFWHVVQLFATLLSALLRILKWCVTSVLLMLSTESFWYRTTERTELKSVACLTQTVTVWCWAAILFWRSRSNFKMLILILYVRVHTCWKPMWKEECVPVLTAWLLGSSGYASSFLRQVKTQHAPGIWWDELGVDGRDKACHWIVNVLLCIW